MPSNLLAVSAQPGLPVLSTSLRDIHSCFWVVDSPTAYKLAFPHTLAHPLVPVSLGRVVKFSEGIIRSCKRCPGNSTPCILYKSSLDEEILYGLIPFSPKGFLA